MLKTLLAACAALVLAVPAAAETFTLSYTTLAGPFGPAVTTNATITAIPDAFTGPSGFGIPQAYLPTAIIGKRDGVLFSNTDPTYFFDNFSEFYFPATTTGTNLGGSPTFLDGGFATLTYNVAGVDYALSRNNATFYQEFSAGISRDILASNFSIVQIFPTAVPEPATWAMMVIGFGAAGGAMRARRRVALPV